MEPFITKGDGVGGGERQEQRERSLGEGKRCNIRLMGKGTVTSQVKKS